MKTPSDILALLPHPDTTRATEHRDIYETIASGIQDVYDEDGEDIDAALTWAKSVCEEYIAHAQAMLAKLSGVPVSAEFDNTQALREGWAIFDGAIERDDECEHDDVNLPDDDAAIAHVRAMAASGSAYHAEALRRAGLAVAPPPAAEIPPDRRAVWSFEVDGQHVRWCGTIEQFQADALAYCDASQGEWENKGRRHLIFRDTTTKTTHHFRAVASK